MSGLELLAELQRRGVTVYLAGDDLCLIPAERIPEALVEEIHRRRAELLQALEAEPEAARAWAVCTHSRVLGSSVWVVVSGADAESLRPKLEAEGDARPVWALSDLLACRAMLEADLREIARLEALLRGEKLGDLHA
jgi:hypothetical protein